MDNEAPRKRLAGHANWWLSSFTAHFPMEGRFTLTQQHWPQKWENCYKVSYCLETFLWVLAPVLNDAIFVWNVKKTVKINTILACNRTPYFSTKVHIWQKNIYISEKGQCNPELASARLTYIMLRVLTSPESEWKKNGRKSLHIWKINDNVICILEISFLFMLSL